MNSSVKYNLSQSKWLTVLVVFIYWSGGFIPLVLSAVTNSSTVAQNHTNTNLSVVVPSSETVKQSQVCECIEYWNCTNRNGQFYSYCGISDNEVCCYFVDSTNSASGTNFSDTKNEGNNSTEKNSTTIPTIWSPNISNSLKSTKPCGVASIPSNLDSIAEFREWPWHIAIMEAKDDLYICGGSLISEKHVLTAAHCLNSYVGKNVRLKIRAGEYDISTNSEPSPHFEVLVKTITLHPNFSPSSLVNDIAILELVRRVPLKNRDNIALICLPSQNQVTRNVSGSLSRCVITGWGRPHERADHSVQMKEIIVPIWAADQCEWKLRRSFGPNYSLPDSALCAGDEGRDACDGDGGGALVCYEDDKFVQHGVVSFGVGCGRAELPGILTRVSSFVDWIKGEVEKE